MVAHLSVPVFHVHAPHIERKDFSVHLRAGIVALAAALLLGSGVALAWAVLPPTALQARTIVVEWSTAMPSTTNWQYPRKTRSFDRMYAPNVKAPSVEYMYAKPRPRNFER